MKHFAESFELTVDYISNIHWVFYLMVFFVLALVVMAIQDINNKRQTIKHNFPVIGRLRYFLETIGPELRQYIVANNREELPFNRSQRAWIYASSKKENNYASFGTDKDMFNPGHVFINPAVFAFKIGENHINHLKRDPYFLPCAKVIGLSHKRKKPFRPYSVINISAMSFGSLSARAVESLNLGAKASGCYHNTGEGSLSPYHTKGADVVFQIGTSYFGCRNDQGAFDMDKLAKIVENNKMIRMIEIKLSQGAKPGKGGVLPAEKITPEIAEIRGIPLGKDVISAAYHTAFDGVDGLMDFIEKVADRTGLPVGIKSAVGKLHTWKEIAGKMANSGKGPDFITIDGGEGGTGAAPPSFSDHVSIPFVYAFSSVYKIFQEHGLTQRIAFIGSGKMGFPAHALKAFSMGVDLINVAREAMLSIGCIQAQSCHTNTCPSGVATQNKWLQSGIDPAFKSVRFANYVKTFRKETLQITHACGYEHPCQMTMEDVDVSMGDNNQTQTLKEAYKYTKTPVDYVGMMDLATCPYLGGGQTAVAEKA